MGAKDTLLAAAVAGILLTGSDSAFPQDWTLTSAPSTNWVSLASSADGTKLVAAVFGGPVFTSTNSGGTWTPTSAPVSNWNTVASSADGTVLVAAEYKYGIWVSTNSGSTWTPGAPPPFAANNVHAATSADGGSIVACAWAPFQRQYLVISTNGGGTWATTNYIGYYLWCVASSADGATLVVGNAPYGIFASTNSGTTWGYSNPPFSAATLACSADGGKVVAGAGGGGTWVSADAGSTWDYAGIDGIFVACSADGMKIISAYNGIFTSTNFGSTWITNNAPNLEWYAVASSADGNKLFAAANGGGIYTWQTTPKPVLNLTPSVNGFLISWVVPSMPFVLQENADLATANWTDVTTVPKLNFTNLHHEVSVPVPSVNRFYRLKSL